MYSRFPTPLNFLPLKSIPKYLLKFAWFFCNILSKFSRLLYNYDPICTFICCCSADSLNRIEKEQTIYELKRMQNKQRQCNIKSIQSVLNNNVFETELTINHNAPMITRNHNIFYVLNETSVNMSY